jgi:hypothetical protein
MSRLGNMALMMETVRQVWVSSSRGSHACPLALAAGPAPLDTPLPEDINVMFPVCFQLSWGSEV